MGYFKKYLFIVLLFMATVNVYAKPHAPSNTTILATNCPDCYCKPSFPSNGFSVCAYDKDGTYIADYAADFANFFLLVLDSDAWLLGSCVCNQKCLPSQIACQDPEIVIFALNKIFPGHNFNFFNGLVIFVYKGEDYYFYCYCPNCFPEGGACAARLGFPYPCNYPGPEAQVCMDPNC